VNEPAVHHRLDDAKVKEISENSFNKNKGLLYQVLEQLWRQF